MDAAQPLDGALDPQEKLNKKRSQNTFRCSGNTSSLFESVFTDARVIRAAASFEKAEYSPHGLQDVHLLSCTFSDKKSARVGWKRRIKEENPAVSRWMSSHGHGWYSQKMSRAI